MDVICSSLSAFSFIARKKDPCANRHSIPDPVIVMKGMVRPTSPDGIYIFANMYKIVNSV